MNVEFTTEARADLFESAGYYEEREAGLGKRFRDEISRTLHTVSGSPYLWRERASGYRRVNCPVFPYYVAYAIRNRSIVVVAIVHGARKPGFWHNRLNG